jgi:hypothetical protein
MVILVVFFDSQIKMREKGKIIKYHVTGAPVPVEEEMTTILAAPPLHRSWPAYVDT